MPDIIVANGVEFDDSGIIQPSCYAMSKRVLRLPEDQVVTVPYYDQALEWNPIWTVSQVMIPRAVLQDIGRIRFDIRPVEATMISISASPTI